MSDNTPQTESILDIVKGIDKRTVMLPEFQRDFRWELHQTYDLFDSLARDIFIGTLIYGKPSFEISCRELDTRPRKGKDSRQRLKIFQYSEDEIHEKTQTEHFRLVLDGQQRITSIYRALYGKDTVYLLLKKNPQGDTLEALMEGFAGEAREDNISVKISDVFEAHQNDLSDEDLASIFENTSYAQAHCVTNDGQWDEVKLKAAFRLYRKAVGLLKDLFKREKLVAYYMLDMSVDKFCLFFERSNSRGIQLNFTDILAAKLYSGFNLRQAVEDFEGQNPNINLNKELIIRAISYLTSEKNPQVDKSYILKSLQPRDFNEYWEPVCQLYVKSLNYFYDNFFILSQGWMPSENLILPFMIFLREIKYISNITEEQRRFIEFWFWASTFAGRYTGGPTNEIIVEDAHILKQIARNEKSNDAGYLRHLRSRLTDYGDVLLYRKKINGIYKGLLNLVNFESRGILDWSSQQRLTFNQSLDDHHIFPRSFIERHYKKNTDAQELVDSVANRVLLPRITNIKIGRKPPSVYLNELRANNSALPKCLESHLVNPIIMEDSDYDELFEEFLTDRAKAIFRLVDKYAMQPITTFDDFFPFSGSYQE